MAHYIDKDALVAEIDRRKKYYENIQMIKPVYESNIEDFNELLSFLDTLEVKDADLEKHLKEDIEEVFFDLNGVAVKGATHHLTVEDIKEIAKYFFELGVEKSVNESIIRKIIDLHDEAVKHYDKIIKKENKENGFSQLAIDLFEHNVDPKELCIQYIIENLQAQKGE